MGDDRKVRVGLVGAGWIGQHHGSNIIANPHAELAAIAEADAAKAKGFLERTGCSARVVAAPEDLFRLKDIDAVIIATPNASHARLAIAAAEAGKHIYLEKPMGITLEQCRQVAKAVGKAGVACAMGYHRRFNPLALHAKSLLAEGKLGTLVLAESDYFHHVPGDLDIWEWLGKNDIAGSLIHAGTGHNIDMLRFFCGEVVEVTCSKDAVMPRKVQVETEDLALITLRFQGGCLGRIGLFLGPVLPFTFTLKLYGTRGSLDNNKLWLDTIPGFADTGRENDFITLPRAWVPDNVQGGISETWKASTDSFIDDVRLGRKPPNDESSGFNTAAVAFAALKSAAEKKSIRPETL